MATDYTKRSRTFRSVRKMDLARDLDNAFQSVEAEIDDTNSVSASELTANLAHSSWWIDPVAGLDTNTGITVGSPLKTWKEFERRFSGSPKPRLTQNMTVNILSSWANDSDPITYDFARFLIGNYVVIKGTATTVRTGTFTSLNQARDNTLNRFWRLTDTGVADWTSDAGVNRRVRITSGAAIGAIGFVSKNIGAGVAEFSGFTTTINPYAGNPTTTEVSLVGNETYVIESLTECHVCASGGDASQSATPSIAYVFFEDMSIGRSGAGTVPSRWQFTGPQTRAINCVAPATLLVNGSIVVFYQGCLGGSNVQVTRQGQLSLVSGMARQALFAFSGSIQLGLTNLHVLVRGAVSVAQCGFLSLTGPVGFDVTGTAITMASGAVAQLTSSTSGLYGTASAYVIAINPTGAMVGTAAAFDRCYAVGTTQDFWCGVQAATVNVFDDSVSPALVVAAVQSFANLRAATPAGLGYRCNPIRSNAFIGLLT